MSTDPELPQTPPPLLPPPPIKTKPSQATTDAAIQPPESGGDGKEEEEECKTPTAPENRIPEPLICPPAPRKPTMAVKRKKTCDRGFFEFLNREEIDSFFGSNFEFLGLNSPPVLKRKCTYVGPDTRL